jgi:CheY-like chemotaxis protein
MSLDILVVDDNKFSRHILKDRLERRNHHVSVVENGWKCLEIFKSKFEKITIDSQKTPFDYVLLDYSMPVLKGNEVAEEILQMSPTQKIIIISAWDSSVLRSEFNKIKNSVEILIKGFPLNALIEKLESGENK